MVVTADSSGCASASLCSRPCCGAMEAEVGDTAPRETAMHRPPGAVDRSPMSKCT